MSEGGTRISQESLYVKCKSILYKNMMNTKSSTRHSPGTFSFNSDCTDPQTWDIAWAQTQ